MLKRLPNSAPFCPSPEEWALTFEDNFAFFARTKWKCNTAKNAEDPSQNGIRRNAFYTDSCDVVFTENGQLHIRTLWKNSEYGEGWYTAMPETSHIHPEYATEGYTEFSRTGKFEKFWCGNPDKNDKTQPYDFVVDSVRCYQRKR